MTAWGAFALPPDQILWIATSVGVAALIRAFTGFGFAMLVVPVFSLILAPKDAVVLSAVLALILGLVTYRAWWGLFPLAPVLPMMAGAFFGTAVGVWFLSSLSVLEFQIWIGGEACFTYRGLGHWRSIGINEWRFRHTRPSGHFVRSGDTQRPCSVAGISDDVFLRVQHCVVGDVQPSWSGFDAAISASVGGYPRDVAR